MTANDDVSAIVYPASGGSIVAPLQSPSGAGTVRDRNGNYFSSTVSPSTTTFTDTLGTTALTVAGSGTPSSPMTYSGTPQHSAVTGSRGNVTTISGLVAGTTTLSRHLTYYDTGNVNTSTDVNGTITTVSYGASACGNSFPTGTSVTVGTVTLTTAANWNCGGGVPTSTTDANSQTTSYAYDNMWRQTQVSFADGGQSNIGYNLTDSPPNITTSSKTDATHNVATETDLDGLGRRVKAQLTSDPQGTDIVDTTYDPVGRTFTVSNPHRATSSPTDGTTTYNYDAMGRTTKITRPDNRTVLFDYTGAATRVQDESKDGTNRLKRVFQSDGLGRSASVCEVTGATQLGSSGTPAACGQDIAVTGFKTTYGYDLLDNITSVTQSGLNGRTYSYDGLSRLTQGVNPESGTTTYTYDIVTAGDLYQRVRPKQNQTNPSVTVTTTYTHDGLHRLTGISYNDGMTPIVTFAYDESSRWGVTLQNSKGRLTYGAVSTAGTVSSYDAMGRLADDYQCTPLNCGTSSFRLTFGYDLLGDLTSSTNYSRSVTYNYTYDTAARLLTFKSTWNDSTHPGTLLTVNQYDPLGQVTQATLGNGIVRNLGYDNRGRLTSLTDGSLYSFTLGYAPDSNILTGNDSVNGNWTYTYDDFGRLATSSKTGQAFSYQYDPVSNRWKQNVTSGSGPAPQYTFDTNNHITTSGITYDAAGNVTNDSFHSYTYDAEGRVTAVDSGSTASYVYDAFSQRVRTTVGSTVLDFAYNQAGRAQDAVTATNWVRGELYAGRHVATYANSTTYFEHADWLGTVRARSNVSGASVETCTSLPFGDGQSCTGTDWSPLHFTGQERDAETGLSHFLYRHLSTTQDRWLTPDPAGLGAVDPSSPQTWNRYANVMNNPLSYVDPLGLKWLETCYEGDGGRECSWIWVDDASDACPREGCDHPLDPSHPQRDPKEPIAKKPANNGLKGLIPSVCAGGGFAYAGTEFDVRVAKGESLAVVAYDSATGGMHGGILAGGIGRFTGGIESVRTRNDWQEHTSPIGFVNGAQSLAPTNVGPLKVNEANYGGLVQFQNGQLTVGGFLGGANKETGRGAGGGGYITLSWTSCHN
jgi:RHS repeat-associated protein